MSEVIDSGVKFLKTGSGRLAENPGFKLVGRDADLERLSTVLLRKKSNSVLIFGPGGVGVSALVLGMQASKADSKTSFAIVSKRFLWLDTDGLFQLNNKEEIVGHFNKIMYTLNRTPESVLVIENARNFVEACNRSDFMSFINALVLAVKEEKTQIILEARETDIDFLHSIHTDVKDQFATMPVSEPEGDVLYTIVKSLSAGLSAHHHIPISDEAVKTAIKVTTENRTKEGNLSRAQPERAITLLDFALASYSLVANNEPSDPVEKELWNKKQQTLTVLHDRHREAEIDLVNAEYALIEEQKTESTVKDKSLDETTAQILQSGFKTPKIKELETNVSLYQSQVDEIKSQIENIIKNDNLKLELTKDHIIKQYSLMTGIPVSILNSDERIVMRDLDKSTKEYLFGQDAQVDALTNMVRIATYGRKRAEEPGSALCLGPSGVGKTEYWKVLAKLLGRPLFIFDMAEYSEKNSAAKLVGAVPGYELAGIGGQLTNAALEFPYGIFVFDEIEKAHDNLFNTFLGVLSDGRLTDNAGRRCSFKKAIVGFTSNIGQSRFLDDTITKEEQIKLATEDLNKTFRNEFLNRFSGRENIIWFDSLSSDSLVKIVKREFKSINESYASSGITTTVSDDDIVAFVSDQYDTSGGRARGARGLPGMISKTVDAIIINARLNNPDVKGTLNVVYDRDKKTLTTNMK